MSAMKLYAPSYYRDFACIADRCRHSCCIGWEIDVDDVSLKRYTALTDGYGKRIVESISLDGTPHFKLCEGDRCPHLNGAGLCRIILSLGEDYLCDICREHPRFYHDTVRGKEVGLGMACEEACRLILQSDAYQDFVEVEVLDGEAEGMDFDVLPYRARLYALLSDRSVPYADRLRAVYAEYGISPDVLADGEWRELLDSLEYLDSAHRAMLAGYTSSLDTPRWLEKPLERALAYFIFRHCSQSYDEDDFLCALGFCLFCERLLASLAKEVEEDNFDALICLAQTVSEELEYSEDNTDQIKLAFE